MAKRRVAVVGAGILGCMLARRLAEDGHAVTVLDAGGARPTASEGSLGWLNASSTPDPAYAALRVQSLRRWRAIAADDADCPAAFNGSFVWNRDAAALEAQAAVLASLDWPAEVLGRDDLGAVAPGLAAPPEAALLAPLEGAAAPDRVVDWARTRALAAGVVFRSGVARTMALTGPRVSGVVLETGETLPADAVALAAGAGCRALLATQDRDLPLREGAGLLVKTAPGAASSGPPGAVCSPLVDFWRDGEGRVLATSAASKTADRADGFNAPQILDALGALVPAWRRLPAASTVRRERPIPADGLPAVGRVSEAGDLEGLWVACTHSGMTLAPAIADALAAEISDAPADPDIAPYRPDRFWRSS